MSTDLPSAVSRALGTGVRVVVTEEAASSLVAAKSAVDAVLRDVDATCSRFRSDSELTRLNARSGTEQRVSPLLGRAIEEGLRAARLTDGDVDLTVGAAMCHAGYDVDFGDIAADGPLIVTAQPVPGWRMVRWAEATRTVQARRGVEIDLGATAKALAADLAAGAALEAMGRRGGVLVSLGGDIALAGAPPPGGWVVQVSDDSDAAADPAAEKVTLHTGAMASSSTWVRRWTRGGVEQHHIIDPATGAPALTPWRLATVVAATCVDANIASTGALVRGEAAPAWLVAGQRPARLVATDGTVHRLAGWPSPVTVTGP